MLYLDHRCVAPPTEKAQSSHHQGLDWMPCNWVQVQFIPRRGPQEKAGRERRLWKQNKFRKMRSWLVHKVVIVIVMHGLFVLTEGKEPLITTLGATIAGGLFHTCMVRTDFSLVCFGGGSSTKVATMTPTGSVKFGFGIHGQIGSGNNSTYGDEPFEMETLSPVDLGEHAVHAVCAGQSHTCVLFNSGEVACWGYNFYGQLGIGSNISRGTDPSDMGDGLIMVDLGSDSSAVDVACGQYHSCAILNDGSLKCWGANSNGRLGLGDKRTRGDIPGGMGDNLEPVDLGKGRVAVAVAGGRYHTCALLDGGSIKCWGGGNETLQNTGQLGHESTVDIGVEPGQMGDKLSDIDLGQGRTAVELAVGWFHTCVILDNRMVKCFGRNYDGQLGYGDTEDRGDEPGEMGDNLADVDLGTDRTAVHITCGRWHTCVVLDNEAVKCFGVSTSDDLGAGQLGLEDDGNRGDKAGSMGDALEYVELGDGRIPVWVEAAYDHSCALFYDGSVKCWGLNASGQLGVGDTRDRGAEEGDMGNSLQQIFAIGLNVAFPDYINLGDYDGDIEGSDGGGGLDEVMTVVALVLGATAGVLSCLGGVCLWFRLRHEKQHRGAKDGFGISGTHGRAAQVAAARTAGVMIAGSITAGLDVVGILAEHLPWVAVAYHMLKEIYDMVDTKNNMEANMVKIRQWSASLRQVILEMGKHIQKRPTLSSESLESMAADVVDTLQALVDTVTSYNQKGTLAQYVSSRSCQKAVDAADTALRRALTKLSVGQGVELMSMVGHLQDAGLVVDEKLDMIIKHMEIQEKQTAALEMRLAEYNDHIAEALGQFMVTKNAKALASTGSSRTTLQELGKAQLDKLQISKDDITFQNRRPFAAGSHSQVYRVVHEGVVKAAKVTNLQRLGLGEKDLDRVFGRFVKELYILSQMHSERVVSVYGAIASPTELTLVMEYAERESLRLILNHKEKRGELMNTEGAKDQLILDMAEGMKYLYNAGVEHRDLKSANCLVTHDWRAKITDFGLSQTTHTISTVSASTSSYFRGGTLLYMAPELFPGRERGKEETQAELSDVFSYGVILWEVLCSDGALPWAGFSPDALSFAVTMGKRLKIPPECGRFYRDLMKNCWQEDPKQRPRFDRILQELRKKSEEPI